MRFIVSRGAWLSLLFVAVLTPACASSSPDTQGGCTRDSDCKGARVCSGGVCVDTAAGAGGGTGAAGAAGAAGSAAGIKEGAACATLGLLKCGTASGKPDGSVLYCDGKTYTKVHDCPSLQNCVEVGTNQGVANDLIACGELPSGTLYAQSGGPCAKDGLAGCSFKKDVVEICKGGKWVDAIHCPPTECVRHAPDTQNTNYYTSCANGGFSVGDMCQFAAGGVICSTDLSKILACSNGTTVVQQDCGSKKCVYVGTNTIGCQ